MNNTRIGEGELKKVVADTLRVPLDAVDDGLEYSTVPQWDSLAHIALMIALEKTFGVTIDDDRLVELTSYAAIRDFLLPG